MTGPLDGGKGSSRPLMFTMDLLLWPPLYSHLITCFTKELMASDCDQLKHAGPILFV